MLIHPSYAMNPFRFLHDPKKWKPRFANFLSEILLVSNYTSLQKETPAKKWSKGERKVDIYHSHNIFTILIKWVGIAGNLHKEL